MKRKSILVVVVAVLATTGISQALTIDLVTVGNAGNAADIWSDVRGEYVCGSVDYTYLMGKFEITTGQYCEFLNAVATTDTYGLYNTDMWSSDYGCKIQRSGSPGSYTYSVEADWANRPTNIVSWGDVARFTNWLHNGQPSGVQDLSTTEDGSYYINGATSTSGLMSVVRNEDATWVIPTEDEWHKAAYYCGTGISGYYWKYPTDWNHRPSNQLNNPDPGNNSNFYDDGYTIGSPYWRTEVGEFENSESPYGTFDQGGNVWEWTEATGKMLDNHRIIRGWSFACNAIGKGWADQWEYYPTNEYSNIGFRIAQVSEPSIEVAVDIKPGGCPNPVNVKSKGVLPVAILGSDDYDVTTIDPTSVRLAGVAPLRSSYEDVAGPVSDSNDCNCSTDGPDGFLDLTLKFKTQRIVEAIGDVNDGDVRVLTLTGVLFDPIPFETPIEGADCILIRGRHKPINPADINKDGVVDITDFAIITENWLQSSIVED